MIVGGGGGGGGGLAWKHLMEHFFSTYRADGFIDLFQNDDTCSVIKYC